MKNTRRLVLLAALAILLAVPMLGYAGVGTQTPWSTRTATTDPLDTEGSSSVEVAPGEALHRFFLTDQGLVEWTGTTSALTAAEYGDAIHDFQDLTMYYGPGTGTTGVSANVPTGSGWEGYFVEATISGLTENRTWQLNPSFTTVLTPWTTGTINAAGSSTPIATYNAAGHGPGNGCVELEIDSTSTSDPYYYDADDRAYTEQTFTVPRGQVVWAGFRMDYWGDTRDDTHYGMTGSFAIYVNIEGVSTYVLVFDDIPAEETWYTSDMILVPTGTFNLPADTSVTVTIGLWSKVSVGYTPEIGPRARVDNFELYLKTRATPTSVNLLMNGQSVTNDAGYGVGHVYQTPVTPWQANPIPLNFTWTPSPSTPDPNRNIIVEFDLTTDMYARRLNIPTVWEINPTAYGERVKIQNGTDALYSCYFYANIPTGYEDRYFFNLSIPLDRDIYFVAKPLAPSANLTSGVSGGQISDGYLNVSAYEVATGAGRYGYWRILSRSANMITNMQLYDPDDSSWKRTVNLRAGDTTRVRTYVGPSYQNSQVDFTVYSPTGPVWRTISAAVDVTGYATSSTFTMGGFNASAGSWMVQAQVNDVLSSGEWLHTGFFKRPFTVTHASDLVITYPDDAVGTWTTNVTYGDLLLVVINANDTDSDVLVAGGTLQLNWVLGTDTFDDSGNGQYTKVLDTSELSGSGQYSMSLTWSRFSYDNAGATLTINVNYAATLESPQYPGVSGAIGTNQQFVVEFRRLDDVGILGAHITCNWSSSYSVTSLGSGSYQVQLSGSGMGIGRYPVLVEASGSFVEPQSMVMYIDVREVYNSISYSANQLSIPVGESDSFTLTWMNDDTGSPVTGGAAYIVCNWTSFHSTGQQNYTVIEDSPGVYGITLFTYDDDPLTEIGEFYTVVFTVERLDYLNHTFTIGVQIRSHNTQFVLDSPVEQTSYGFDIVVLVSFQDTDLMVPIDNVSGYVTITVTSPTAPGLTHLIVSSSLGAGHYNITISSNQWGTIGWKDLTISVEWTGTTLKYYGRSLETSVRVLGTDTDVFLEQAPTATYYLDNFSFTVVYYDNVNSTRISNSTGHVRLLIVPLTGGHPVTQGDFSIAEIGTTGTYRMILNSSLFAATGTFRFQIDMMWGMGVRPLYENQTMTVVLTVLERPTYVDYVSVPSVYYGQTTQFVFSYVDSLTAARIENSSSLVVGLNDPGVVSGCTYDSGSRSFTMTIDTTSLGGVGTFTLHLNLTWTGPPFYASIESKAFTLTINLRATQLTHEPFLPPQWGNDVVIVFLYTDLVSGSPVGMIGVLTLNASLSGSYSVVFLGDGVFRVTLDTSAFVSDGTYTIIASVVYTGSNFAAGTSEPFAISILKRSTQLGYESPDPAEYLDNVTFIITYTDDSTGAGIDGASVALTCGTAADPLVLDSNYWIEAMGTGGYKILVDSTALGALGTYVIDMLVTRSGTPFYLQGSAHVNARVVGRSAQIQITQTPGETPYLENVTFLFKFTDVSTGEIVAINKDHILLSYGLAHTVIAESQYSLVFFGTYYSISFSSTIFGAGSLVTGILVELTIDRSASEPYYVTRTTTTQASTVARPTLIVFPLIGDTPYFSNLTVTIEYLDYLTSAGITGASVVVTTSNVTVLTYYVVPLGAGQYRILVPTTQFSDVGVVVFDVATSRAGAPFYAPRIVYGVPTTIRPVQTSLAVQAPSLGALPPGYPIVINVTLTNYDQNVPVSGATITTDWTTVTLRPAYVVELGGGRYQITLNTTGLLAQQYVFKVYSEKVFYADAEVSVIVQPGSQDISIQMERASYFAEWGEVVGIRFDASQSIDDAPLPGSTASLTWGGAVYPFADLGNGTYVLLLDTSVEDFGIYRPSVTVVRPFYQTKQVTFTLAVSKGNGQILPQYSVLNIVMFGSESFWVYLDDTVRSVPVADAIVWFEWNNTVYPMSANGTDGYYVGFLNVSGFAIGPYSAAVRAASANVAFLDFALDVNVIPIPVAMSLAGGMTSLTAYYGEILQFAVNANDTRFGGYLIGANVTYVIGGLYGSASQLPNGTYLAGIDTSLLSAQTFQLKITCALPNYATTIRTILVTIRSLPTEIRIDPAQITQSGYHHDNRSYALTLYDMRSNVTLSGAEVTVMWEGRTLSVEDLANGTYLIHLNINMTQARTYEIEVRMTLPNYATAQILLNLAVLRTPTTLQGPTYHEVPVNDTVTLYYTLLDNLTGQVVSDINGVAVWHGIGEVDLGTHVNGSYYLNITGDLIVGHYEIVVSFYTSQYDVEPLTVTVYVRPILTWIYIENATIMSYPGSALTIRLRYLDLDHGNTTISGVIPAVVFSGANLTYYPDRLLYTEDGWYVLEFLVNGGGSIPLTITMAREGYATQVLNVAIESNFSESQLFVRNATLWGSLIVFGIAVVVIAYVRIYSVPRLVRVMNGMIRALAAGKVPKPAKVHSRLDMVMAEVNNQLQPVAISKVPEDVDAEPIKAIVPEVNELLERLAAITGLGETELQAFRNDLSRMKASERPGFLREVIKQEEARRAEQLAGKKEAPTPEVKPEFKPEDLEDLKVKLQRKGIAPEEIEIILEQAKTLSKADLSALLESLGISLK